MSFYDDASWLLIPSGIEEDVVFAQKPTSGLGDLTFTRASDATYTDASGVVRRSPYNLLQRSEEFENAYWIKINGNTLSNTTTAPNGTLTADSFTKTSGINTVSDVYVSPFLTTGAHTLSVYIKPNIGNSVLLRLDRSGNSANAEFNFTTKTFVNSGANILSSSFVELDGGWFRLIVTANVIASNWQISACNLFSNPIGDSMYIWGAQLVEGTEALNYFPTTNRQDVPRIDFRNADGTLSSCGRLLLEPQRTNLVTYSQQFDNAAYTKTNVSVTANTSVSPDGYANADTILSTAASPQLLSPVITFGAATNVSVFVKYVSQQFVQLFGGGAFGDFANFDIQNATLGTSGASTANAKIENYGNGWLRISATFSGFAGGTTARLGFTSVSNAGWNSLDTAFNKSVLAYGFQAEVGAYPTSYIPTTTAAVTRLADFASKTGVSSLIGQSQGTLFVEVNTAVLGNVFSGTGRRFLTISDNTLNNRIILFQNATNDFIQVVVVSGGVEQANISTSTNQSGIKKIAAAYANNDFVLYINGVQIGTDTSGTVPSCDRIALGFETTVNLSNPACPVAQAALFPTRLTNAQLAELTTL